DAQNPRAKSAQARFERGEPKRSENARLIAAGSILAAAVAAIAFILLRKPSPAPAPSPAPPPEPPSEPEAEPESASKVAGGDGPGVADAEE
ncbi:MAG TPA: hypothetical protein VHP33_16425, partial [Polyangiaceae bacterium]|nr:hypothetical protein [Polyangiaceae bacterium]